MIYGIILIILCFIGGCYAAYKLEQKNFNNGICPICGTKLTCFDTDSQGGKGFMCRHCGYTTWVSWFDPFKKIK